MSDDLSLIDEPIDVPSTTVAEYDDAEFSNLVERLDEEFPPVSRKGFDFSKIRGNITGRTAKAIVLHLSCHGWSLTQISEAIGVKVQTCWNYLTTVLREVSPVEDVELARNMELSKLDANERSAWEQFERSCEDEVTVTDTDGEEGGSHKVVRKGQAGSPAYLKLLLDISKRRAAMLGLDKPAKMQIEKTERKMQITEVVVRNRQEVLEAKQAGLLEPPEKR